MTRKRITVVTGTRAEYGLLKGLMRRIREEETEFSLSTIVTGMHLSPEFGSTWQEIAEDGFEINEKVEMLLSSDTPAAISKSMGLGMIGFSEALAKLDPDILVVLGDRFETFSAVSAAMVANIPVAHLHGGEITTGAIDDAFRHSITKMSHLHFTATEEYRKRVIQLGEDPDRVYFVGGLGVDSIKETALLDRTSFEESINFELGRKNLLVTYHPVTLEVGNEKKHFSELLNALENLGNDTRVLITRPNADTGGRIIIEMIDDFVEKSNGRAKAFSSLGQKKYFSALSHVDCVVGNSSSGLLEAPSFNIGTINIGTRQDGRTKASSVIDCDTKSKSILESIEKVFSDKFQQSLESVTNPYGEGGAADKIISALKEQSFKNLIKKKFYDL